jgi:uncharacterized membrane protein
MTKFLKNRSPIIWAFVLVTMFLLRWIFPAYNLIIQTTFLLFSFGLASFVVVAKNRESYRQGKFTRSAFLRNNIIDVLCVLLAMIFAGLLANYLVQFLMGQADNEIARFAVATIAGLLVGLSIGILMKRIRGMFSQLRPSN